MKISAKTKICMVIGDPIEHSLSPAMHNAGYRALGIDREYIFVACRVRIDKLSDFIKGAKAMGIHAISCTIPHKEEILKYIDTFDLVVEKTGAVNTVVNKKGKLAGYNTDWQGAVAPLEKITSIKGKNVALIGAGGAARAIAYGMAKKGAVLSIFNRSEDKAKALTRVFGGKAYSLDKLSLVSISDIIINATPKGMHPKENESPVPKKYLKSHHIVLDAVYKPQETKLLRDARKVGAKVITGLEILLYQGVVQFKLYTGLDGPKKEMQEALYSNL